MGGKVHWGWEGWGECEKDIPCADFHAAEAESNDTFGAWADGWIGAALGLALHGAVEEEVWGCPIREELQHIARRV